MQLTHLAFMVRNLEKSIEFYETVAELSVSRRFKAGPGEIAFMANRTGETEIELVCMPEAHKFEGSGFFLCFVTDKLDEMRELVQAKGMDPSEIRNPDAENRYFYVYDPDGVSVQLKQSV